MSEAKKAFNILLDHIIPGSLTYDFSTGEIKGKIDDKMTEEEKELTSKLSISNISGNVVLRD